MSVVLCDAAEQHSWRRSCRVRGIKADQRERPCWRGCMHWPHRAPGPNWRPRPLRWNSNSTTKLSLIIIQWRQTDHILMTFLHICCVAFMSWTIASLLPFLISKDSRWLVLGAISVGVFDNWWQLLCSCQATASAVEEKLALSQSELQQVKASILQYESLLDSYKIQVCGAHCTTRFKVQRLFFICRATV